MSQFQSYFIQDYRWKSPLSPFRVSPLPVSILLHSGLPLEGWLANALRDRRHVSILLHSGLPLEAGRASCFRMDGSSFNPTSFRITVGRVASDAGRMKKGEVSILLHSGLPLEGYQKPVQVLRDAVSILLHSGLPLEAAQPSFWVGGLPRFQSYFIQDYRWKLRGETDPDRQEVVSILLHSGLPLEGDHALAGGAASGRFNPTSFRITVGRAPPRFQRSRCHRFNPTSFRITVGRSNLAAVVSDLWRFQSYFIQDYRWKLQRAERFLIDIRVSILLHSGLPLEGGESTPDVLFAQSVSILLHSGLPLEESQFNRYGVLTGWFQSYFIQDYRWKIYA